MVFAYNTPVYYTYTSYCTQIDYILYNEAHNALNYMDTSGNVI